MTALEDTVSEAWSPPPPIPPADAPLSQPIDEHLRFASALTSAWARDLLFDVAAGSPRSLQAHLGPSEIGQVCDRRLAYRLAGTPIVNLPDPLKAMFGTGMHQMIADGIRRRPGWAGRYLVEHQVTYKGISGSLDLFDRVTHRCIDYKTSERKRIRQYQADGIPTNYAVQTAIYAAGLEAAGEQVDTVCLVFIPRDGGLEDIWTSVVTPDRDLADRYVERYLELADQVGSGRRTPADLPAFPSALCTYCPNYRPGAADLTLACPGKELDA